MDPNTLRKRLAYRIHIQGKPYDEWVWGRDLERDKRYEALVEGFEDSLSLVGKRIAPRVVKWVRKSSEVMKRSFT